MRDEASLNGVRVIKNDMLPERTMMVSADLFLAFTDPEQAEQEHQRKLAAMEVVAAELEQLMRQSEERNSQAEDLQVSERERCVSQPIIVVGSAHRRLLARDLGEMLLESTQRLIVEPPPGLTSPPPGSMPFWANDWRNKRGRKR